MLLSMCKCVRAGIRKAGTRVLPQQRVEGYGYFVSDAIPLTDQVMELANHQIFFLQFHRVGGCGGRSCSEQCFAA